MKATLWCCSAFPGRMRRISHDTGMWIPWTLVHRWRLMLVNKQQSQCIQSSWQANLASDHLLFSNIIVNFLWKTTSHIRLDAYWVSLGRQTVMLGLHYGIDSEISRHHTCRLFDMELFSINSVAFTILIIGKIKRFHQFLNILICCFQL